MLSTRFSVTYYYQTPSGNWIYSSRTDDTARWSGPRGRSETSVATWLRTYHRADDIRIESLEWGGRR